MLTGWFKMDNTKLKSFLTYFKFTQNWILRGSFPGCRNLGRRQNASDILVDLTIYFVICLISFFIFRILSIEALIEL